LSIVSRKIIWSVRKYTFKKHVLAFFGIILKTLVIQIIITTLFYDTKHTIKQQAKSALRLDCSSLKFVPLDVFS